MNPPLATAPNQVMRDDARDVGMVTTSCQVCGDAFTPIGRARYCSQRCRQRAWRLRQRQAQRTLDGLAASLRRERRLVAQTVYVCPSCADRLLAERRCPECNLMCAKVGLGGQCPGCDEIVTIADLLGPDLDGGDAAR